jgi:hypothetical protein
MVMPVIIQHMLPKNIKILYGNETLSLTLREELRLKVKSVIFLGVVIFVRKPEGKRPLERPSHDCTTGGFSSMELIS